MRSDGMCELGDARCVFVDKQPSEIILDQGFRFRPKLEERKPFTELLSRVWREPVWIAEVPPSFEAAEKLQLLKNLSLIAVSVPDNPLASLHIEASSFAAYLKRSLGCEVIVHLTCRDLDRLALKSRLLSLHFNGIEHVLALTGDHPSIRSEARSTPIFDLDSIRLIYLARIMSDHGVDELGNPISRKLRLQVGAGLNPYIPLEVEISRALRKIRAGAEFFATQIVFAPEPMEELLKVLKEEYMVAPIFVGFLLAGGKRVQKILEAIGVPASEIRSDLRALAETYLEILEKLRRTYGPVGAFISTLGRLENLRIWDDAFRSLG